MRRSRRNSCLCFFTISDMLLRSTGIWDGRESRLRMALRCFKNVLRTRAGWDGSIDGEIFITAVGNKN